MTTARSSLTNGVQLGGYPAPSVFVRVPQTSLSLLDALLQVFGVTVFMAFMAQKCTFLVGFDYGEQTKTLVNMSALEVGIRIRTVVLFLSCPPLFSCWLIAAVKSL